MTIVKKPRTKKNKLSSSITKNEKKAISALDKLMSASNLLNIKTNERKNKERKFGRDFKYSALSKGRVFFC